MFQQFTSDSFRRPIAPLDPPSTMLDVATHLGRALVFATGTRRDAILRIYSRMAPDAQARFNAASANPVVIGGRQ